MRIVLDTNCLVQCISRRSSFHSVWQSIIDGANTLCVSNEIVEEYVEILQLLASKDAVMEFLNVLKESPHVEFINPQYRFHLIEADPDDNKFVDCAVVGNAKYIVTNDRHFDILQRIDFPKVDIITLKDFLVLISKD